LVALFLLVSFSATANNYYFSSSSGNDSYSSTQAQSQSTPWKTISKLNSFFGSLVAGDNIYFKKGDVFYGRITVTKTGSSGKPITFTSYGTGNRPVISGFTTVSSWSSLGNNIYQATVSGASTSLNMVSINGIPRQMGRYPNLSYTSDPYLYNEASGSNYITDDQLNSSTNWTGAYAVIRKKRWIMDRCKITNHSGGTLSYTTPSGSNYTTGLVGFGYFIQNDPRTLDQFGEWYLNPSTKALQVHFGGSSPSAYGVKVSTVDTLINLGYNRFITFTDLGFEGANVAGLYALTSGDITIRQCDFTQMGKDGILIKNSANVLVENVNVNYVMNNGINLANGSVTNSVIRSCNVKNIGMFPGMGGDGDGTYVGVGLTVNSTGTVEYTNVDSIGHDGIQFQGGNINIRYNFINNYSFVKDDAGGIYTIGSTTTYTNRNIYNNIVLNGKGCSFGSSGKTPEADGIYMDRGTKNVNIFDNSVAHMGRSCFLSNNVNNVKINGNTAFNARWGVEYSRIPGDQQVRSIELKRNIIYPRADGQNTVYYKNFDLNTPSPISIQADMQAIGTLDSNYYGTATSTSFGYYYSLTNGGAISSASFNLANWKTFIKNESASKYSSKSPASVNDLRFEYNATTSAKTITLDANYVDVQNNSYNGSVTLQPYTSKILIKNGSSVIARTGAGSISGNLAALKEKSTELKISSYPNPTVTNFGLFVEGGTDEKVEISVMSSDGRIVFRIQGTTNNNYRFGNSFTPGLYIIKVVQGSTAQILKVIKG